MKRAPGWLIAVPLLAATFSAHAADDARTPLYYQDPSGAPFYAAGPEKDAGRPRLCARLRGPARGGQRGEPQRTERPKRRILYYRNPMGLPDTSPVPKKDSMGMDYLPVYADEAGDAAARCASARAACRRSACAPRKW